MLAKRKGNKGEREWVEILNRIFKTKYARTPMSGACEGLKGDVRKLYNAPKTIVDLFHWEIKRVEKLNVHKALQQSIKDARAGLIPCVAFRRNHEDWRIVLPAEDFLQLLKELQTLRLSGGKKRKASGSKSNGVSHLLSPIGSLPDSQPQSFEEWTKSKSLAKRIKIQKDAKRKELKKKYGK